MTASKFAKVPSETGKATGQPLARKKTSTANHPRSERAHEAVLDATMSLLETCTVNDLTIDAIAKKSGAAKTTIYRRWPTKTALVIDAFVARHNYKVHIELTTTASEALASHFAAMVKEYGGESGRLIAQIVGIAQFDYSVLEEFRARFWQERRDKVAAVIKEGQRRGEFRRDVDPDTAAEIIYSTIYFRLLLQTKPLDKKFVKEFFPVALSVLTVKR